VTFAEYRYLVLADLYRYQRRCDLGTLLTQLRRGESYKFVFWMRTCAYTRRHPLLKFLAYPVAKALWKHYTYKLGLSIPYTCAIGPGFYIGHFGTVVVSRSARLGRDVNISQGVTVGRVNRGKRQGAPTIGDRVYIGPGAKIVGAITVGDGAAIGANCVVIDDVPPSGVVVGIPGKVVSEGGSDGYVEATDYERLLGQPPF
jgi:serine O-acetyltransferase